MSKTFVPEMLLLLLLLQMDVIMTSADDSIQVISLFQITCIFTFLCRFFKKNVYFLRYSESTCQTK